MTMYPPSCTPRAPGTPKAAVRITSPRLCHMIAAGTLTGCPRKYSATQVSAVPASHAATCHAPAATSPLRFR